MFGLQTVDLVVILLYFAWLFWIGLRSIRSVRNQQDFFLGGRRFGRIIATFTMFGQATSAETVTNTTTQVRQMGWAGIMVNIFPNFIALPVMFFAAKWYRRLRLLSMSEFFVDRYKSKSLAAAYAISQAIYFILVIGIGLMAAAKTFQAITPKPLAQLSVAERTERDQALRQKVLEQRDYLSLSEGERQELTELRLEKPRENFSHLNKLTIVTVLALVVWLYAIGGGLEAAAKADVLQGTFILILTLLLLPTGIAKINTVYGSSGVIGAFQSMHRVLPEAVFEILGSPANAEMTWYLLLAILLTIPNTLCQPNNLVVGGSARDDRTAQEGVVGGLVIKRFATVLWGLAGMIIFTIYVGDLSDPDMLWGMATRDLLGSLGIGLVGLMAACLMSALMSTAAAHMITVAALLTDSVYKPLVRDRSERHYVMVGRVFSTLYLLGGVGVAMIADDLWTFFKYMLTFNFIFAAPFLMGILWRRANPAAVWVTVVVTGLVTLGIPLAVSFTPLTTHEALLEMNISREIPRTYKASLTDVVERKREIDRWKEQARLGQATGEQPAPLKEGDRIEKIYASKERSIFWDSVAAARGEDGELLRREDGSLVRQGEGLLRVEMVMLELAGVPLKKLSYPMLETLRFVMKFLLGFGPFFLVAWVTRPMDAATLDQFYGRLRTPSCRNQDLDEREVAKTVADPRRFDRMKLFPNSSWEFNRWTSYEKNGVLKTMVWVILIYVAVVVFATLGTW